MYGNGYGQQGRASSRPRGGRDRESDQRTFEDSDNKLMSIGGGGSERGQRRQAAVSIQQLNYEEQMRMQANVPRRDRDAEMRVFEEAAYKHIGGGTGGSASGSSRRASGGASSGLHGGGQSKSAAQAQYVAQLQADAAYKEVCKPFYNRTFALKQYPLFFFSMLLLKNSDIVKHQESNLITAEIEAAEPLNKGCLERDIEIRGLRSILLFILLGIKINVESDIKMNLNREYGMED